MGRPLRGTCRGDSTGVNKARWTPKWPSKPTEVTGTDGGKSMIGLVILITVLAGKSRLNSTTLSGWRLATAYPSRACNRCLRKESLQNISTWSPSAMFLSLRIFKSSMSHALQAASMMCCIKRAACMTNFGAHNTPLPYIYTVYMSISNVGITKRVYPYSPVHFQVGHHHHPTSWTVP